MQFILVLICLFFKQKTAYEMRISDWSSDVCSSDLDVFDAIGFAARHVFGGIVPGEAHEIAFVVAQGIARLGAGKPLVREALNGDRGAGECARLAERCTNVSS